ncbi:exopolyphosphatase/guanosine-5'-triphosphate,3'-diphosphate pyrophosphatase [Ancylobacter sp. 3268]|uniref:Ppx/GppA phosphatase family protein n=1 Tax=Ancylobacter sp. 3268 TaxID=2817752 RepID=UPI00285EB6BA|nr:Ppx/GppA phosphatase family protein [Ancylobacter sp. 3268]MDR6954269.1 exopolyphosphatase/guanosine-5'-triphosphate,3'-diphosphate pyrophosphatase [Ancylobacter sp. 3268]
MVDETHKPADLRPAGLPCRDEPPQSRHRSRHWHGRRGEGAVSDRQSSDSCYAALDLGTNNCRLLVARPTSGGFRVVDAFSRIVRLGEGLIGSGRLGENAMTRAVEALSVCAAKLSARRIAGQRLIATEACRSAANGDAFIARVEAETGLQLEIVDRETEARLAAAGCTPLVDPSSDGALLFDIGGGSTEVVWLDRVETRDGGPPAAIIRAWVSVPLGVVTVAERHGGVLVTRDGFEAMVNEFRPHLDGFVKAVGPHDCGRLHLLGTSGTVTTIAGVHLDLPRYDRSQVDGTWLDAPQVGCVVDRLLAMPFSERVANPCIGAERADLVLAGCAILEAVRRAFPCDRLRVADRGLREGILVELMRADRVWCSGAYR